jgi:hypothetical protein
MLRRNLMLAAVFAALFIQGCSLAYREQLVGTWRDADGDTVTLLNDGTFSGNWKTGFWGIIVPSDAAVSGTWTVSDKNLVIKVTNSTFDPDKMVGMQITETIVALDKNTLRTTDTAGTQHVYTRLTP